MSSKKRTVTTRTLKNSQIDFKVWDKKTIEAYPITEEHIGQVVSLAQDPSSKNFTLEEIKSVGDKYFPEGGYVLDDKESSFPLNTFLDEVIPFPEKKKKVKKDKKAKKSNSQLSRKAKVKTKKK